MIPGTVKFQDDPGCSSIGLAGMTKNSSTRAACRFVWRCPAAPLHLADQRLGGAAGHVAAAQDDTGNPPPGCPRDVERPDRIQLEFGQMAGGMDAQIRAAAHQL